MNEVALSNVKEHLFVKVKEYEKCEQMAIEDGMSESYIEMYHDMALLFQKCLDVVSE